MTEATTPFDARTWRLAHGRTLELGPKALIMGVFNWASFFEHILPPTVAGVAIVLENPCFEPYTYRVNGGKVVAVGDGVSILNL